MKQILEQLQKQLYKSLKSDQNISKLVRDIYNIVPDNSPFPYIQFGDMSVTQSNLNGSQELQIAHSVHAYNNKHSFFDLIQIAEAVRDSISERNFEIPGCIHIKTYMNKIEIADIDSKSATAKCSFISRLLA